MNRQRPVNLSFGEIIWSHMMCFLRELYYTTFIPRALLSNAKLDNERRTQLDHIAILLYRFGIPRSYYADFDNSSIISAIVWTEYGCDVAATLGIGWHDAARASNQFVRHHTANQNWSFASDLFEIEIVSAPTERLIRDDDQWYSRAEILFFWLVMSIISATSPFVLVFWFVRRLRYQCNAHVRSLQWCDCRPVTTYDNKSWI